MAVQILPRGDVLQADDVGVADRLPGSEVGRLPVRAFDPPQERSYA